MITSVRNSLSGMRLSAKATAVSASNTANAHNMASLDSMAVAGASAGRQSGGYDEAPHDPLYTPQRVDGESMEGGGVRAVPRDVTPAHVVAPVPGDPHADEHGRVARTNVDLAEEAVRSRQARTHYAANLRALLTADEMLGTLLDNKA